MYYIQDPLWLRLQAYSPDKEGDVLPFSKKLSREQGWSDVFTQRAIEEYKRFIFLCCTSPNGASPSKVVDEVWHLHLTYTVDYWMHFCKQVLQKDIHHHPSGGSEQQNHYADLYLETLRRYEEVFGVMPPADIWIPPKSKISEPVSAVSFETNPATYLLLLVPVLLITIFYRQPFPFLLSGPHFLVFFGLLILCALMVLNINGVARRRKLDAALSDKLHDATAYELAYLAGGYERVVIFILAELINGKALILKSDEIYSIDKEILTASQNPVANEILSTGKAEIHFLEARSFAGYVAAFYENRYQYLQSAFNRMVDVRIVAGIVGAIGILRVLQGAFNEKPVGLLIMQLIFFAVVVAVISKFSQFHEAFTKLVRMRPHLTEQIDDGLSRTMIYTGFAAIAGLPLFLHLERHFSSPSIFSDSGGSSCGSSDSGTSSSCGSSDGGSCGGCGGGD